jgi:leucyl aminopeptidase
MKVLILLAVSAMASMAALAALLPHQAPLAAVDTWDEPPEVSLIQLSDTDTRWVTDEQKWALKMVCCRLSLWCI